MVQDPSPEAVEAIRHPSSIDAQIAALRQLKNDIVGHQQRKELLVRHGFVQALVDILSLTPSANGKRRLEQSVAPQAHQLKLSPEECDAKLQSALILASVAGAGAAFVAPLLAANLPVKLVDLLKVDVPPRLQQAVLQALRNLAASWLLTSPVSSERDGALLSVFQEGRAGVFDAVLRKPCTDIHGRLHLELTLETIIYCAADENTRIVLVNCGTLDTLTSLLCAIVVRSGMFSYDPVANPTAAPLPCPPPEGLLYSIVAAISAIVEGSGFRTLRFVMSEHLRHLLMVSEPSNASDPVFPPPSGPQATVNSLLPQLQLPPQKSVSFSGQSRAFPVLGALQTVDARSEHFTGCRLRGYNADHAAAVCGFLLIIARSQDDISRLTTLRLLAFVNNFIEADAAGHIQKSEDLKRSRDHERQLSILAVPLVMCLMDDKSEPKDLLVSKKDFEQIKEQCCEVLALLIQNNRELQNAAIESAAIKRVCPILKKSFDSVPLTKPLWSARPAASDQLQSSLPKTCQMGERGLPAEILHVMRCRQTSLEALAALARDQDTLRKAIVDAGVIGSIIDSLKPLPNDFLQSVNAERTQLTSKDGNTVPVILAACHAAQSMSRSVSLLRTSLIDAGIAVPLFNLLTHPSIDVQIAATDVCCNLVLDFSPMREDLLKVGVIAILTQHARQGDMRLRISSLWALKHLVLGAPKDIKFRCLEELGPAWLVTAIQGQHIDQGAAVSAHGGVSVGLIIPNAAGEQVDILNPSSMEVDDPPPIDDDAVEEVDEDDDEDGELLYDEQSSTHYQSSQLRSTLQSPPPIFNSRKYFAAVRDLETNPVLQAKRYDIAVQEQALDFIRNYINGEDNAVMLDHLFKEIGHVKIFQLLTDKLSPLPSSRLNNNHSSSGPNWQIYQPLELILSAIHVITHIANSSIKNKSLLISQRNLLTTWLPHFAHPDKRVRVYSVWAINSLTWLDDENERQIARARAQELRIVGIEAAVRALQQDPVLDVRERVKTALRQIDAL